MRRSGGAASGDGDAKPESGGGASKEPEGSDY